MCRYLASIGWASAFEITKHCIPILVTFLYKKLQTKVLSHRHYGMDSMQNGCIKSSIEGRKWLTTTIADNLLSSLPLDSIGSLA